MGNRNQQYKSGDFTPFVELIEQENNDKVQAPRRYRRERVEENIQKRTRVDGVGRAVFDVQVVADGRAISRTFSSKADARKWRDQMRGKRASGRTIAETKSRLKLRDFVVEWDVWLSEEVEFGEISDSTAIWYRYGARHVVASLGHQELRHLTHTNIRRMEATMSRQGASKSKTRQARLTLRSILWLAYEQDLIARDPTSMLEGKRRRKRKSAKGEAPSAPKAWGTSDAKRFLEFVRGDEMEALWVFYLSTGVRRGEALGLEWSSVDLEAGTVTIRQQLCIVGRELRFQQPKTDSSTRTIAMGPELVAVLDAHRRTQIEMRLSSDSWDDQLALVFAGAGGRPIRPDYVTKRFKHLVHEAGLEWIRLHGLRHTMASLALQNGTDIATVSRRLGHSDTNITARIYLHGSEESDRHAATALDELLIGY